MSPSNCTLKCCGVLPAYSFVVLTKSNHVFHFIFTHRTVDYTRTRLLTCSCAVQGFIELKLHIFCRVTAFKAGQAAILGSSTLLFREN